MDERNEILSLLQKPIVRHIASIIVGVILGVLGAFANHWAADLAIGIIGFCATEMLIVSTSVIPSIQKDIALLHSDLSSLKPYAALVQHEHSLEHLAPAFTFALDSIVKSLAEHGLAIVSADNGTYLDLLKNALHHGKDSYFATLVQPYTPWWFFTEDGLQSWKKQNFLEIVRDATGFNSKTRLLIYDWYNPLPEMVGEPKEIEQPKRHGHSSAATFEALFLQNIETTKQFLQHAGQGMANNSVNHYLFDWGYMSRIGGQERLRELNLRLYEFIKWVIQDHEDFGVVDSRLIIKKRPYFEVQVIPLLGLEPRRYKSALDIFRHAEEWWIPLTRDYVDACSTAKQLLSRSEYLHFTQSANMAPNGGSMTPMLPPRGMNP